jgi:hypothetical protein
MIILKTILRVLTLMQSPINVWYTVGTGGTSSYTNDINVAAGSYFGMLLKTVTASDGTTTYQFKLLDLQTMLT